MKQRDKVIRRLRHMAMRSFYMYMYNASNSCNHYTVNYLANMELRMMHQLQTHVIEV